MKKDRISDINMDQISKLITGNEHNTHWRINAPSGSYAQSGRMDKSVLRWSKGNFRMSRREAACWRLAMRIVLSSILLCFATAAAFALDPRQPPSGNFDLSHWKLTLPDTNASEILSAQLTSGYSDLSYFYTGPDGGMVFSCPVTGGTTDHTSYPRCELREMLDPDHETVDWTGYGTNILSAQCKITRLPSSKKVIIGQIHSFTGNAFPLVKLQYDNGTIEAMVKESPLVDIDTPIAITTVDVNKLISYRIQLVDGLLSVTVNGVSQSVNIFQTDPAWTNQTLFFKAGDYCQDNSGATNEVSVVEFYQLSVEHYVAPTPAPKITINNFAMSPAGYSSMTVLGQNAGSYFIQSSSDLTNWSYVMVTNSISGRVDFTDTAEGNHAIRFYRAGTL